MNRLTFIVSGRLFSARTRARKKRKGKESKRIRNCFLVVDDLYICFRNVYGGSNYKRNNYISLQSFKRHF